MKTAASLLIHATAWSFLCGQSFAVIHPDLSDGLQSLKDGRNYLSGFPDTKTRRQLRDLYLGVDGTGGYTALSGRFDELRFAVDDAVGLRLAPPVGTTTNDLLTAQDLAWQSLEAELQGQLMVGNFNLLKGLRVAFPSSPSGAGQNQRPGGETILPVGSPKPNPASPGYEADVDGGYRGARITDLMYAREHFARGVTSVLEFMASDSTGEIRSTDLNNGLGTQFPQYTRFNEPGDLADPINFGNPADQGINDPDIRTCQTTGYLLGNILDRYGKAVIGMGDRMWKAAYFDRKRSPGQPRDYERQELLKASQTELRKNAHFQYLASLPLAAAMGDGATSTLNEFETCRVDQARVSSAYCGIFIDRIRRGEIPKLDSFELNASTPDINSKINQVKSLGTNAATKYNQAKDAIWKSKTAEAEAITAAQQLRTQFTLQLADLSGIDPGIEGSSPYGGLITKEGRSNYQIALYQRIGDALKAGGTSELLTDGSDLGKSIIGYRRSVASVVSARNRIDNIPQEIKIIEDREGAINGIILATEDQISAYRLAVAESEATTVTTSVSAGVSGIPLAPFISGGVAVTYNPGRITSAGFQNKIGYAEAVKQVQINNANAAAEIRNLLLQQYQHVLELDEAVLQAQLAFAEVKTVTTRIDRLIQDHIYYQNTNASKWWSDPALMFEREKEELDYDEAQTEYIRELYVLTQMIGVRWAETFENPAYNRNFVPQTLGGGLYDNWTQSESLFNAKDNGEADNYFAALQAWDLFLRNERTGGDTNYTSDVVVSLRQDILGWSDVVWNGSQFVIDATLKKENLKRFQAWLLAQRNPPDINPSVNYQLRIEFPLVYNQSTTTRQGALAQQPTVLQVLSQDWNLRLLSLRARLIGSNVTQINPYRLDFYQYGRIEIPRYHPRLGDKVLKTINLPLYYADPMEGSTSPYRYSLFTSVGASSNPPATPMNLIDAEPSPFCNKWIMLIEDPGVGPINLQNMEDIELLIQLKSGRPPTFAW